MGTEYTLEDQAGELAGLLKIQAERQFAFDKLKEQHQSDLDAINEQVSEAREELHQAMVAAGVKKVTHPLVTVSRAQGTRVNVTNKAELIAAITEKGMLYKLTPREVTTINYDMAAAKKIGERHEMPGVEVVPFDEPRVRMRGDE